MSDMFEYIRKNYSDEICDKFKDYLDLLLIWNEKMNLTAITDPKEIVTKHFIDSLIMPEILKLEDKDYSIVDIGPGAGFPSIPLRLILKNPRFVLIDSLAKRLKFLEEVIRVLELHDVELRHDRCEDAARDPKLRQNFDIATARAVANLSTLSEYCLPFVKKGGSFIAYKSADIDEELTGAKNGIKILGGQITKTEYYTLPESDLKRSLVVIEKKASTPGEYPRKAGLPAKKPLL